MNATTLRKIIRGEVLDQSIPAYESVLSGMLWNQLRADRRPDLIVRVSNEQDVVHTVRFAEAKGLRVVARGGGHSWCGLAVRNGGIVIDLELLKEVKVEPEAMRARIQPCVSNRDLIGHLEPHGLAFPTGHCPQVKASGYLLSGGIGWNAGEWGHACHSIEAIDIVTAQGELVRSDISNHPDLFWAARGGGAGFPGVAVGYHLRLYPMPRAIFESTYYYQLEHIKELGDWAWSMAEQLPKWVEFTILLLSAPAEFASQCASTSGKVCLIKASAFADDPVEATNALALLENFALRQECLSAQLNQATSFTNLFDASGAMWPEGLRSRAESLWSNALSGEMLLAASKHFVNCPSPATVMLVSLYPGWEQGVPDRPDTAFSISAKAYAGLWTMWRNSADDAINNRWHDEMMSIFRPFTIGHYLGETDIVEDRSRTQACFASSNWKRLQKLRGELDPKGLFQGFDGGI